ncbi:MAG: carbamate kinase [Candidatus Hydrogenedentota bacterium]|nr:MAG: carbamate kinase [Candidatus Hydrogenedentota bacterium]
MKSESGKRLVVALGGNAIQKAEQVGTIEEQFENSAAACHDIAGAIGDGYEIILTHGNGPQVGNILRRVELASREVYSLPLDICVADSEGGMGYMLQQVMANELRRRGVDRTVVTVVTRCVVDHQDPAFENPTKPIGPFLTEEQARRHAEKDGWRIVEDSGRGWRRVVPSPQPKEILERDAVRVLAANGFLVVACGGGGIPVYRDQEGNLKGVEAVIDKDLASARLALDVAADKLVILTGVEKVKLNFGTPAERALDFLDVGSARRHLEEGQFPPGSMGPKIQAAIHYLEEGGGEVLITATESLEEALKGKTGTRIIAG